MSLPKLIYMGCATQCILIFKSFFFFQRVDKKKKNSKKVHENGKNKRIRETKSWIDKNRSDAEYTKH